MTKLILSTGNVMSAGPSIIRKRGANGRSNLELLNSLRDAFSAAQIDYAPETNGSGPTHEQPPLEAWTEHTQDGKTLFVPRVNWKTGGLREEAGQYEITVKLFLLPNTPVEQREGYAREALELVRKELGVDTIDLLVVSFPGMSFGGTNCEYEADAQNAQQGNLTEEIHTWTTVIENLHRQGLVKKLGVAEFGSEKLAKFLQGVTIKPVVNQINLKDCCNVPPPLKQVAIDAGVELNVHRDCTDVLPHGTLRELLGPQGAGVLAGEGQEKGLKGEVLPRWVVRYMAFVRDRGVIENKGYFAGAELNEGL